MAAKAIPDKHVLNKRLKRRDAKVLRLEARIAELEAAAAGKLSPPVAESEPLDIAAGIDWIQDTLIVPTGLLQGQPFVLQDWQIDWIQNALRDDVRYAGISIARKCGKSSLLATMFLAWLVGPWNRPQWRGLVTSIDGGAAEELRLLIQQTAEASGIELQIRVSPKPGKAYGLRGARLDFLAADDSSGHAAGADIACVDEAGQLSPNRRNLWNAMISCISGRNGKFFALGIQGDSPMFRELESRAGSPAVYWIRYQAPSDCDLLDESAWRAANPALGSIKSLEYMRDEAQRASENPANQNHFRAYDLNQNLNPENEMLIPLSALEAITDENAVLANERVVIGIDLGETASFSACTAIGMDTGVMRVWGAIGDDPPLMARGRNDGCDNAYVLMEKQGDLKTYPGKYPKTEQFLHDVFADLKASGCTVAAIGTDRYRKGRNEQAQIEANIRAPIFWRGRGASATADGSADIAAFQRLVYDKAIRCRPSLQIRHAIQNSTIKRPDGINAKLQQSHSRGRIDVLSAAVIAAGLYEKRPARRTVRLKFI